MTSAHDKLRKNDTPRDEEIVEKGWTIEWEQEMYYSDPIHLFEKY